MPTSTRWKRPFLIIMAFGLVAAACGSDDDDESSDTTAAPASSAAPATDAPATVATDAPVETEAPATTGATETTAAAETTAATEPAGEPLPTEGQVEVAAGTVLDLDVCPDDWNPTQGVEGDEIRIGQSLPQSGPLAAFGQIGDGMKYYFDYVNETDPIEGKEIVLITRDDVYEAGRAVANIQEMLETEDIFAFMHLIGTPINAAVRPITAEACVPQLYNSSGFPIWGDPTNFPWTTGNILNYVTETNIWCDAIVDEFGEGATVAALIMNNDFGKTYQSTLKQCEADGKISIAAEALHDPAAPDVSNEMTTIIASDAQVFIAGTTAAFCPQTVAAVAASEWRPRYYMSYTCGNLASFFTPVQEQAGALATEGAGVRMTNLLKVCGDPAYDDDPAIVQIQEILETYGDVTCADGSYSTGVLYGQYVEQVLRDAVALPGGLNRVNLMAAAWNADFTNDNLLGGTLKLDGVNDAYLTEAAQIQEVQVVDGALTYVAQGDVIDTEGEAGSYQAP